MSAPFHTVPQFPVWHKESKPWLLSQLYKSSAQQLLVQMPPCTPRQFTSVEKVRAEEATIIQDKGHPWSLGSTSCSAPGARCGDRQAAAESSHYFHSGRQWLPRSPPLPFKANLGPGQPTSFHPRAGRREKDGSAATRKHCNVPIKDDLLPSCFPSPVIQTW